jgi:hypothetical protein
MHAHLAIKYRMGRESGEELKKCHPCPLAIYYAKKSYIDNRSGFW